MISYRTVVTLTLITAVLLCLGEFATDMHPTLEMEHFPLFYPLLAIGVYGFFIIFLKFWRMMVKRSPHYYEGDKSQ